MLPYATRQELLRSLAIVGGLGAFLLLSGCADAIEYARDTSQRLFGEDEPQLAGDAALTERGYQEMTAGDYGEAEVYFESALTANPTNPHALLNLGVVYEKPGRYAEARAMYTKVIALNPPATVASSSGGGSAIGVPLAELAQRNLAAIEDAVDGRPVVATSAGETRLAVLEQLYAANLISESEWSGRAAGASSVAGEPSPVRLKDASERLRSLVAYQASGVISDETYANERRALLEKILPLDAPSAEATPSGAPAPTPLAQLDGDAQAGLPGDYRVLIASYRSPNAALNGWEKLKAANGDVLGPLEAQLLPVDLGPDYGVLYRVEAGPVESPQAAEDLCAALKARNVYCMPIPPQA